MMEVQGKVGAKEVGTAKIEWFADSTATKA